MMRMVRVPRSRKCFFPFSPSPFPFLPLPVARRPGGGLIRLCDRGYSLRRHQEEGPLGRRSAAASPLRPQVCQQLRRRRSTTGGSPQQGEGGGSSPLLGLFLLRLPAPQRRRYPSV